MPTQTYIPLANLTLSTTATTITLSSISQSYRDLVLNVSSSASGSAHRALIRFNGDTASNYSYVSISNSGVSALSSSGSGSAIYFSYDNTNSAVKEHGALEILDYSATDKHKPVLSRGNIDNSSAFVTAIASRWANTSAITSITISNNTGQTFDAGSIFTLFGIASA